MPYATPERQISAPSLTVSALTPLAGWRWLERFFDRFFGSSDNPLRQLGALGFLTFWLLALSGIWLYAVFESSVSGAYASIERLSEHPWSLGGLMRSLHRYSADAFVLLAALHLLREAIHGRWRFFRRFSWLTGTATVPLIAVSAVGGFWINWDRLGQFSAIATAELLDAIPLLSNPLARNFLDPASVTDRLFSLLVFVHLGVPLLLLFALWFHLQRIARASVFPTRRLASGTLLTLLALAVLAPVAGQGAADLTQVPQPLSLDAILLFAHPLMYATSAGFTWFLLLALFGLLLLLPFVPAHFLPASLVPSPSLPSGSTDVRSPIAVVDPQNCSGCRRCFVDCPYAAITMTAHPIRRVGRELAVVDADLCAGCGICAGSCPSSTPFRGAMQLHTGIDMPQLSVDALRRRLREAIEGSEVEAPIVVFRCERGADLLDSPEADTVVLPLICAGQIPPSFVEYALRDGAGGIVIASCRETGCEYRLGARWTRERLEGLREPRLRQAVAREDVSRIEADAGEEPILAAGILAFRSKVQRKPKQKAEHD